MSDVTEAVTQDQIAESLLGDQNVQEQTAEETQAGAEAVEQTEQFESQETEQQLEEETPDDWLPSDQDKVFPDEVYAKYAQRYQFSPEQASDPLIRQLLHDKINSDILIRQQQEQEQLEEFQLEEPTQEPTQQQAQQQVTFEQHLSGLKQWAQQNTDPRIAQSFADEFMQAFGVTDEKGQPAKASPEIAQRLTSTMTTFGMNLMQTALPQIMLPVMETIMPGFSGMYFQSARASAWDNVRNSDAKYAEMPAYGTKEFVALCNEVAQANPRLTQIGQQLEAANGGELYGPRAEQFYGMLADLASRPKADPQQLLNAARAGAASARRGQVRKDAGNLGAGQSKGLNNNRQVKSQFQTNQDIFDDDTMNIWQREHGRL